MKCILYVSKKHKKINGTLFYCYEYFSFLNQFTDVKFLILNADEKDFELFNNIFKEKYSNYNIVKHNIINVNRTDLLKLNINTLLFLDIVSYEKSLMFISKVKNILMYSNNGHKYNIEKTYGFYDYQKFNYKTRLKFFIDIHKTYNEHKNKTFISALEADNTKVLFDIGLKIDDVYMKENNKHHSEFFKNVNKIIYWHVGNLDKNNRLIVEAYIHNLDCEVYCNGYFNDSVFERYNELKQNGLNEFNLTHDDILIKDFLNAK